MKTILIISNVTGGLYSFRKELIEQLVKRNKVVVLASYSGREDELKALGCELVETKFDRHGTNPLQEIQLIRLYKQYLRRIKPDIVLTYTIKPNIYGGMACAALKIPFVANITGLGTALENPGLMQKILIPLSRYSLRKAQKVFFQNEENRDFMLKHKIVQNRFELIPGSGVNLAQYQVLDYPDDDMVNFVFIARIMKEKGIDQYLDAARYIRGKYPYTRFHICGNCEQAYQAILKEMQDSGVIIYHGRVKDIASIHRMSQCTIHPTYYPEGMSNVLLESCACGRPIITTDRAGCREIINDGVNGFIVKQKDTQDLIEKIEKFLALSIEERRAMGLAGRLRVERDFDRNIVIQKYLDEIEKVDEVE